MTLTIAVLALALVLVLWAFYRMDRITPYDGEPRNLDALSEYIKPTEQDDLASIEAGRKLYEKAAKNRTD